jgi:Fe2+ or Zn2+ uptake regulation protein
MKLDMQKLFAKHNLRVTMPRRLTLKTLEEATKPLSPVEIAKLNSYTINKVSVYRTIDVFLKLGIVVSVPYGWKQRYELASPFRPHHHHLLCTKCGVAKEIQSDKLERIIHMFADQQKFKVTGHTFEITGVCHACQLEHD